MIQDRGESRECDSRSSALGPSAEQSDPGPSPSSGSRSTASTGPTTTSTPTSSTGLRANLGPLFSQLFRSSSRRRSRHRHGYPRHTHSHTNSLRRPWLRMGLGCQLKRRESNFFSAACNMLVMVLLCTAMVEPQWFYLRGGGCRDAEGLPVLYLGISSFFYLGHFIDSVGPEQDEIVYNYGPKSSDILVNCVSPGSVEILRSVIALCFVALVFALLAFLLDLAGPSGSIYKILHRNAIFSILTVVTCVTITGFCYWVANRLDHLQHVTKLHRGSRVEIRFSVSFYLVATAGAMSVIATACNLLRKYPSAGQEDDRDLLINEGPYYPGISGTLTGDDAPPAYTP